MPLRKTSIAELTDLFSALGAKAGDTAVLHSALFTLGRIENGLAGLYEALRATVGDEGTIVVPTFTFSFRRGEVFDVRSSPVKADLGAFPEHVRLRDDAIRSLDPYLSMAAIGPRAEALMERRGHDTLGAGSTFELLFEDDCIFLAVGITYSTGLAAFMHLERLAEVDYRIPMRFEGKSAGYDGVMYDDYVIHFVRDESRFPYHCMDRGPRGRKMEEAGVSTAVDLGSGHHFALRAGPFMDYVLAGLRKDPYCMIKKELRKKG